MGREGGLEAPGLQDARRVGEALDAGADLGDLRGGFEDVDGVAGEEEGDGGAEAGEAGADDCDLFWGMLDFWGRGGGEGMACV